ncbi:MAG TPA: DUF2505 domain-containing protein [Byssovorax sp.]|jgi:hypothetical protein
MPTIHLAHEIACDVDTFWKIFFDKEFNTKLYRESLGFPEFDVLELTETDTEIRRKARGMPKMNVPGAIQKLFGSNFRYEETGVFDRAKKEYSWKFKPSALEGKLIQDGTVRAEPHGEGKVRRVVKILLEAKVFGVGGLIESTAEKQVRDGWDNSARFMNEWLKKPR